MTTRDAIFEADSQVNDLQDKVHKLRRITNDAFNRLSEFQCVNATQEYQMEQINLAVDILLDYVAAAYKNVEELQALVETMFNGIVAERGESNLTRNGGKTNAKNI